jgi:hypothetical protein
MTSTREELGVEKSEELMKFMCRIAIAAASKGCFLPSSCDCEEKLDFPDEIL